MERRWRRAERRAVAIVLAIAAAPATPARAESPPPEALALEQVVSATLANNTDLKLAALAVDGARGALMAAAAPFDSAISGAAGVSQSYQLATPPQPPGSLAVKQVTVAVGWNRRLRWGLLIAPSLTTTRTRLDSLSNLDSTQTTARLTLSLPLLRDLGGAITAAPEREARGEYSATALDERQAGALGLLRAAAAYWSYLAARRRLEVLAGSESRAELTTTQTASLVKADERTRADLIQAQGFHSSRRTARITAEQDLVGAWRDLALLIGSSPASLAVLPEATTDFPAAGGEPSEALLPGWVARALAVRPDLAAADLRISATEAAVDAARSDLRPALDLEVSGGYTSQQRGPALRHFVDPFYRDLPGMDASVQVRYQLPIEKTGARGRLVQSLAIHEQRRVLRLDLERRIRVGVSAAFEVVKRSALALRESEEAVKLLQQTVDNEKHKFRLGSATLFSVIQAEDALTSGLLARTDSHRAFATALANLRYESGTLVSRSDRRAASPDLVSRLTHLPEPD
jgi:outer membrane protein